MNILDSFKDMISNGELENKKVHEHKFKKILRKMIYNKGIVHYLKEVKFEYDLANKLIYSLDGEKEKVYVDVYPANRLITFTVYNETTSIDEGICLKFHKGYFDKKNKVRNIKLKNRIVNKIMDEYHFKTYKDLVTLESNKKEFQKKVEEITDNECKQYLKEEMDKKINEHESLQFK